MDGWQSERSLLCFDHFTSRPIRLIRNDAKLQSSVTLFLSVCLCVCVCMFLSHYCRARERQLVFDAIFMGFVVPFDGGKCQNTIKNRTLNQFYVWLVSFLFALDIMMRMHDSYIISFDHRCRVHKVSKE